MSPRQNQPECDVADLQLAIEGLARIDWADAQMPVLAQLRRRLSKTRPLAGIRIAACLHVTAETGILMRTLKSAGAEQIWLCAANPLSTQDDVAAALVVHDQIRVFARRGATPNDYLDHQQRVLRGDGSASPILTMDDGADLIVRLHQDQNLLIDGIETDASPGISGFLGGTEETSTGALRLRQMADQGQLQVPVIAVHEAATHRMVENRHGTGQSALDGILRATNVLLAGRTVVVFGYGSCGRGVAVRAQGMGAGVTVCEIDPIKALEAKLDGFNVASSIDAAKFGDVFITVTGSRDVLTAEHFKAMKDGVILANAGHFNVEIAVDQLSELADEPAVVVRPLVERYVVNGKRLHLLAGGRVVNLAAAEGYPASVMDLSFTNQALALEALALSASGDQQASSFAPGVHAVPHQMDTEMARLKLESLGIKIDAQTVEQSSYGKSWRLLTASR